VPVLVAVRDIPAGAQLNEDLVRVERIPAGGAEPQALYGPGQIAGMYAAVPLFRDEMLTARHISPAPRDRVELAPDQRLVAVPVRSEAALGAVLRPGDTVDVAAAWPGDGKPDVEVLVSGVKVADLHADAGEALLAVSSAQAKTLTSAMESKASLYLWLAGRDHK
jgi:Flp pilus assembly protein CpaB